MRTVASRPQCRATANLRSQRRMLRRVSAAPTTAASTGTHVFHYSQIEVETKPGEQRGLTPARSLDTMAAAVVLLLIQSATWRLCVRQSLFSWLPPRRTLLWMPSAAIKLAASRPTRLFMFPYHRNSSV
eukprot:GHUV01047625.1.p1 GENE.GHUV01047625.1~~GHUV01047625.1.p1  ORF type:complete len:129 (-),score=9.28 GHUV01047625.1:315-701(-)